MSWRWLSRQAILAIHGVQLAEHGGRPGLLSEAALDAALSRPRRMASYRDAPTVFDLAAAYAFAIAKVHHPFADGNKRTALLAAYVFLGLNGRRLEAPEPEAAAVFIDLAAGKIGEAQLSAWLGGNSVARGSRARRR